MERVKDIVRKYKKVKHKLWFVSMERMKLKICDYGKREINRL